MLLNILLICIFLASASIVWYRLSLRIPALMAVPDDVVGDWLHNGSAKFHLFLLRLTDFWRGLRYKDFLRWVLTRAFYRVHIFLLRADNAIVRILQALRNNGKTEMPDGEASSSGSEYWNRLRNNPVLGPGR